MPEILNSSENPKLFSGRITRPLRPGYLDDVLPKFQQALLLAGFGCAARVGRRGGGWQQSFIISAGFGPDNETKGTEYDIVGAAGGLPLGKAIVGLFEF